MKKICFLVMSLFVTFAGYGQDVKPQMLSGKVIDSDGKPVSNAKVVLYYQHTRWGMGNRIVGQTESGIDGSFTFEDFLKYADAKQYPYGSDSYVLLASHSSYAFGWKQIVRNAEQSAYEIILTSPKSQTITVTDHDGNPLAGVRVWPYSVGSQSDSEPLFRNRLSLPTYVDIVGGVTGADGKATITNLPKTSCSFYAELKGYAAGLSFSGSRPIRLSKGATVSGTVLDEDKKPVEGALIKFHTEWMWNFFLTRTDSQGRFRLEDLPAEGWDMSPWGQSAGANGIYVITIEHEDYIAPEAQDTFKSGDIVEDFAIDAYRGTLINCRVVDVNTNLSLAGARIYGSNESGRIDGRTDANGVLTVRVMSGQTSFYFGSPPEGLYMLRGENPPESSIRFDAQGEEKTVTIKSPPVAGRLTTVKGKVRLPDGSPAANIKISTTNSESYETLTWGGAGGAYTSTNSDGSFEMKEVPAGLKLFLYGNTKDNQYVLAEVIENVEDPTVLSAPLIMKQGQETDILLTDKRDEPVANLALKIRPMMWGNQIFRADSLNGKTDAQGQLKMKGILPGMEYFVIDSRGEDGPRDMYYNQTMALIPLEKEEAKIPSFDGIDIKFDIGQAKDKMLLICFWDIQQRPSRNLVKELAKREKELREKDVVVLLVHSSDIQAEELNKWIEENKIPFASGRITGEPREVLYRWGVRSQPWLVLADENENLKTEGFDFNQLDEKLQEKNSAGPAEKQLPDVSEKILLRLVDSNGLPVDSAKVGTNVRTRERASLDGNLSWTLSGHENNISNQWGEISLLREKLFPSGWAENRKMGLYVLHEVQKIGAICEISKNNGRSEIELTLVPVCHVYGKLGSDGLKKINRPLYWTNVYFYQNKDSFGLLSNMSEEQKFEFLVPPGKYGLYAYGSGEDAGGPQEISVKTKVRTLTVEVKQNQGELDLGTIDLLPTKIAALTGKPAPEIGPIKTWKNGSPIKLAELRGKIVILHFGGEYPSTSRDLPELIKLHESFKDEGLVIISLYNCESMEQLEQRFVEASEKYGGQNNVPYRIAVDGGEPGFFEGTDKIRLGSTYNTYDITTYPTTILIDPQGTIVGNLNIHNAGAIIQKLLSAATEP
ncbi:MAG: redoxin domain-containing protein [Sedimentisphaerales bacterium]|nr:redoxin domain-containing protein [Sedimentisphaerales bacterium]